MARDTIPALELLATNIYRVVTPLVGDDGNNAQFTWEDGFQHILLVENNTGGNVVVTVVNPVSEDPDGVPVSHKQVTVANNERFAMLIGREWVDSDSLVKVNFNADTTIKLSVIKLQR